jgi:lysyl-tRNA synthetase, class I
MHWLDQIAEDVMARHPEGEILIESGGSPSGTHHIGHMRELVTCDAILLELRRRGRQARHIYFVDDLDNLRKVPIDVPAEFEKYLGMPICDVPAPDGSDQSYADYFLQSLIGGCAALNVEVEFIRSHKKYREGFFTPAIERCLERIPAIRKALETVSGRRLEDNWSPLQVLEDGRLKKRTFLSIDTASKTIRYEGPDGNEKTLAYDKGDVKLDWRLDWPGRWWLLGVQVEPSGRDHMTKGSSYDTGVEIMRDVYEAEAPYPVSYDFINMVGDTKKMSASKGTGMSAVEGAKIIPAEVMRYFILRAAPLKRLYFDPVNGVVQLMDEFAAFAAKADKTPSEEQLWHVATRGENQNRSVSRVPFSHLVASYQASLKNVDETLNVIGRTEHAKTAKEDATIIREELKFIDEWLRLRAPEEVKFALAEQVQASDFSEGEQAFLKVLSEKVAAAPANADGTYFHERIYELKDEMNLPPKDMFNTLYRALIGKPSGPRAGWFLSILPRDWLVKRLLLKDATNEAQMSEEDSTDFVNAAQLTAATKLVIDEKVQADFPEASIGYLVATLPEELHPLTGDPLADALKSLQDRGVTAETLTAQPEIAVWRAAFGKFGVKPSKYLSSAEALAKRALKGSPAQVSPVVDSYNSVSIKHLLPMGALDLDKVQGDLVVRYGREGEKAQLLGMEDAVEVTPKHVVYADDQQVVTWLWNHRDAASSAVKQDSKHVVFLVDSLVGAEQARQATDELSELLQQIGAALVVKGVIGRVHD